MDKHKMLFIAGLILVAVGAIASLATGIDMIYYAGLALGVCVIAINGWLAIDTTNTTLKNKLVMKVFYACTFIVLSATVLGYLLNNDLVFLASIFAGCVIGFIGSIWMHRLNKQL
jgi:lysylphosphatidylglycerol synthetase-like protein (DUF2156 family)